MMKTVALLFGLLFPLCAFAQSDAVMPIDGKASLLKWTGHAEVGTYAPSGTLAVKDGRIVLRGGRFASAQLTIDMTSLQQDNADLTHHLKSADFFDVEKFPVAVIAIDRVAGGFVYGTLTLKGKSAPFQSPVKVSGTDSQFAITGKVELDRTKYGIVYNSTSFFSGLGDKAIRNTFEVEFTLKGAGEIPAEYRN